MSKRTMILGASPNPERYAFLATQRLNNLGHEVFPVGRREGKIGDVDILTDQPYIPEIDTITLYIGPKHQSGYFDYIEKIAPKRVIFNPGTEQLKFEQALNDIGIHTERACTLVLLSTGNY